MLAPFPRQGSAVFARSLQSLLGGRIPLWLSVLALALGLWALTVTPREEEPQIVVPMLSVEVAAPGLDAPQVSRQVVQPLEKLLAQIPGMEHVYATAEAGRASVLLRFHVGEDRQAALVNTFTKLNAHLDQIPSAVAHWQLSPREVDDVPILVVGLWSEDPERYGPYELRQLAEELVTPLQALPATSEVRVQGGRPRVVSILLDREALAARETTALDVFRALQQANHLKAAGDWTVNDRAVVLEGGDVLRQLGELEALVVNVIDGVPITLGEVASLRDGPGEAESYTWLRRRPEGPAEAGAYPLVTLSLAKQPGTNAVTVSAAALETLRSLQKRLFPDAVSLTVLRDYGETADEKVNDLTASLAFAVLTVVLFLGVFLGPRAALVVGLAVPVCYGLTLALDYAFGYTINRVTLFALILALGLLVDDPITGVDNISRFLGRGGARHDRVVEAMMEIRSPLIMSTVMVVLAFLPLAAIPGMMGPYMAPMAFNVPVSVMASTLVAFLITPWLAARLLPPGGASVDVTPAVEGSALYRRLLAPLLTSRGAALLLGSVVLLFCLALLLPGFRAVPLKLLPFDNKNEVQVLIDMPEGTSLERTAAVTERVAGRVLTVPEVREVAAFVGQPSPVDFNGLVRRYDLRQGRELGELRVVLAPKAERSHQSHAIVLRLRALLAAEAPPGAVLRVVEVPPGPPVLSTLVAEVVRDPLGDPETHREAARRVMARLAREPHVVEVDSTLPDPRPRQRFVVDKTKAALAGVDTDAVATTLQLANRGLVAGMLQVPQALHPVPLELRLPPSARQRLSDFEALVVRGQLGGRQASTPEGLEAAPQPRVALGELGAFEFGVADAPIHRKDLEDVIYVTAELNGRTPGEVIADLEADRRAHDAALGATAPSRPWASRSFFANGGGDLWHLPAGTAVRWAGEGELALTLDVFKAMGLGYLFALAAIYLVLRVQTRSNALALIIMSAIPLTIIGILPGFWAMNHLGERVVAGAPDPVLFTATAMIGMIALAGIVVRNSLILVEFITQARAAGASLRDAVLNAGAIRLRPVLLTAGTTLLGNLIITLDPVFNGLALAIIFGIVASTLFTLAVVPVVYWLVFRGQDSAPAVEGGAA